MLLRALVALAVGLPMVATVGVSDACARNSLVSSLHDVSKTEIEAFHGAHVKDTRRLYQKTYRSAAQREQLSKRTGLHTGRIDHLAAVADLCRLYRVTPRIAHLMVMMGVVSMDVLARQEPLTLHQRIHALNQQKTVTDNPPSIAEVSAWTRDAGRLQPKDWEQLRAHSSASGGGSSTQETRP